MRARGCILVAVTLVCAACQGAPATETADTQAAPAKAADPMPVADDTPRITGDQLAEVFANTDVFVLDVRRPDELQQLGTVAGYTNIPIEELGDRLDELPRDRPILTA